MIDWDFSFFILCFAKVYNERFATDTHSDFFRKRALKSGVGLGDYPTYGGIRATDEELHEQQSYFIGEMDNLNRYDEEVQKDAENTKKDG